MSASENNDAAVCSAMTAEQIAECAEDLCAHSCIHCDGTGTYVGRGLSESCMHCDGTGRNARCAVRRLALWDELVSALVGLLQEYGEYMDAMDGRVATARALLAKAKGVQDGR